MSPNVDVYPHFNSKFGARKKLLLWSTNFWFILGDFFKKKKFPNFNLWWMECLQLKEIADRNRRYCRILQEVGWMHKYLEKKNYFWNGASRAWNQFWDTYARDTGGGTNKCGNRNISEIFLKYLKYFRNIFGNIFLEISSGRKKKRKSDKFLWIFSGLKTCYRNHCYILYYFQTHE